MRGCELTPEALDVKEREELDRVLRQSGLVEGRVARATLPAGRPNRDLARDLIQYEIEIESDSATVHVKLDDLDLNDEVAPLVAFLQGHARPMPLDRP